MTHQLIEEIDLGLSSLERARSVLASIGKPESRWKTSVTGEKEEVTNADVEVNEALVDAISARFPNDVIIGEELSHQVGASADRVWVVDPIDGTRSFARGYPGHAIVMSFLLEATPVFGIVYDIAANRTTLGVVDQGIFRVEEEKRTPIVEQVTYDDALIWNPFADTGLRDRVLQCFGFDQTCDVESTSLRAVRMAEGLGKVFFSLPNSSKTWDSAAAYVIVGELGGSYTDLSGGELTFTPDAVVHEQGAIATIGIHHEMVLDKIRAVLDK